MLVVAQVSSRNTSLAGSSAGRSAPPGRRAPRRAARAVAPRHVGGGPGLVQEHQPGGIERRLLGRPGAPRLGYIRAVLLRRPDLPFLSCTRVPSTAISSG